MDEKLEQQIIALLDEHKYHKRRAEDTMKVLQQVFRENGLPNGFRLRIEPIQREVEVPTDGEKTNDPS